MASKRVKVGSDAVVYGNLDVKETVDAKSGIIARSYDGGDPVFDTTGDNIEAKKSIEVDGGITASAVRINEDEVYEKVLVTDSSGLIIGANIEKSELNYLQGVSSNIQDQIDTERSERSSADSDLNDAITSEADARTQAVTTLTNDLESETEARTQADSDLSQAISTERTERTSDVEDLESALASEAQTRQNEDDALSDAIDDEASARASEDSRLANLISGLTTSLASETSARESADTSLQTAIENEASDRADADTQLATDLQTETTDRISAINTVTESLTSEIADRQNADAQLQTAIENETRDRTNEDASLDSRLDAIEERIVLPWEGHDTLAKESDLNTAIGQVYTALGSKVDKITASHTSTVVYAQSSGGSEDYLPVSATDTPDALALRNAGGTIEVPMPVAGTEASNKFYVDTEIQYTRDALDSHVQDTNNPHSVTKEQVGLGYVQNYQLDSIATSGSPNYISSDGVYNAMVQAVGDADSHLQQHTQDTNNPHSVTKEQVGLEDVINATMDSSPTTGSTNYVSSGGVSDAINTVDGRITQHIDDTNNPHNVDKEDVGLGNVINATMDSEPTSGSSNYVSSGGVATVVNSVQSNLDAHIHDTSNPHNVDKDDVGLGNVDNTSDMDKPVSTLQQTAIDGVQNNLTTHIGTNATSSTYGHVKMDNSIGNGSRTDVTITEAGIKAYVNSSIGTSTATFLGTYSAVSDLGFSQATVDGWTDPPTSSVESSVGSAIASALSVTPTNNDYVFVSVAKSITVGIDWFWRFKFDGSGWVYEYTLNNSSFTQAQWDAINSGITSANVTKLNGIQAGAEVNVNADWNATSGDAQILNKPTIPTVNNGTLNIQGNGTTASSFGANQSGTTTLNIKGSGGTTVTKSANNEITISTGTIPDITGKANTNLQNLSGIGGTIGDEKTLVWDATNSQWKYGDSGKINDVQLNGVSVVSNKIANLPAYPDISGKADKSSTVTNVAYNSTSKKIQKTINGTTSDVVTLSTVATSGSYNDLSNKPTIPDISGKADKSTTVTNVSYNTSTKKIQKTINGTTSDVVTLSTVATSGSYNDLSNKPTIPTVPTNVSAFNNDAGYTTNEGTVTQVKVGTTEYIPEDGVVSLPAYPSVGSGVLTIKQNTTQKGTFSANATSGTTITLTDTWTPMTGATSTADGTVGYVNAVPPTDGYNTKYLRADGTWTVPAYPDISGKADKSSTVTNVSYNSSTKKIQKTINGSTTDVVTLSTVATTGAYSDLSGKPTIPDVSGKADKSETVTNVAYNTSTKKISKTINGTTSDVVTLSTVATTGSYNDLSNKPTIPDVSGKADKSTTVTNVAYDSSTKKISKTINGTTSDVVTLSTVATSGSYNDLSNKPTIPDVSGKADKSSTVTNVTYNTTSKKIQKTINGTTSDVVTLATVATSGSYNDLSNRPTIPTVYDNKIDFKVGATSPVTAQTFKANQSSDVALTFVGTEGINAVGDSTNKKITISENYPIYYAKPNETTATATLTATIANFPSAYRDGIMIALRMPFNNVASSTLCVNGLESNANKPIYYANNTTTATRWGPAGCVALLVYETTTNTNGCWKAVYSWESGNSGTWDTNTNDRFKYGEAVVAGSLVAVGTDGLTWKIKSGKELRMPLVGGRSTGTFAINGNYGGVNWSVRGIALTELTNATMQGSAFTVPTWAIGNTIYLRGTIGSGGGFVADGTITNAITNPSSGTIAYVPIGFVEKTNNNNAVYMSLFMRDLDVFVIDTNGRIVSVNGKGIHASVADSASSASSVAWGNVSGRPTKLSQFTNDVVNNATLTIQKNGTNVQTFTANQSGNATANITVPTKTSELTNDSGYTTNTGTVTTTGTLTANYVAVWNETNKTVLKSVAQLSITSGACSGNSATATKMQIRGTWALKPSAIASNTSQSGYSYRYSFSIPGCLADYMPVVSFPMSELNKNIWCPVAESYGTTSTNGGIYLYAKTNQGANTVVNFSYTLN